MAPKRSCGGSSRGSRELNHAEEWIESVSNEAVLNQLVVHDMLHDRVTGDGIRLIVRAFLLLMVMNY